MITTFRVKGHANADRKTGFLFTLPHSPSGLFMSLEGYGVEITMFEVTQVDVSDTPLALPQSATPGLSI